MHFERQPEQICPVVLFLYSILFIIIIVHSITRHGRWGEHLLYLPTSQWLQRGNMPCFVLHNFGVRWASFYPPCSKPQQLSLSGNCGVMLSCWQSGLLVANFGAWRKKSSYMDIGILYDIIIGPHDIQIVVKAPNKVHVLKRDLVLNQIIYEFS